MDAKEEIKQRLSIEEVVGDYLELKRAGRNFKAISPFTSERTPSFMVSPEKQIWHDFSSNKGGDVFSFVMEVEGVEFREALEILARKANIDLSQFRQKSGTSAKLKARLFEINNLAAQFYHLCLSKNSKALSYIKEKRGFTPDTIRIWRLGYSPDDGSSLLTFLTKRGFTTNELLKAGLITKRRGGYGDMFRGRIMIPLGDGQGNVVGFTARLLEDGPSASAPKYFNTPQTLIYDKGRQVYGLHLAKEQIRKQDFVIIVEGNLDVIASHQAGVANVVATAGTAMTADHLRHLSRLSLNIRLAFDTDEAGLNATERAISIAQTVGVNLGMASLPASIKDPDELIQNDTRAWVKVTKSSVNAVQWILQRYEQIYDKTTAEGKRQLSTKALAVIRGLSDPVEREHHLKQLATSLDVSLASLNSKLQQTVSNAPKPRKQVQIAPVKPDQTAYEDDFLALNVHFPEVRDSLGLIAQCELHTPERESLKKAFSEVPSRELVSETLAKRLHLDSDYVKILQLTAEEKYSSWTPGDLMAEAMALARRIHKQNSKQKKIELSRAIAAAEASGDIKQAQKLLTQFQQIINKE